MTPAQVSATQIPVNDLVDMIVAIGSRDYAKFQELENNFAVFGRFVIVTN